MFCKRAENHGSHKAGPQLLTVSCRSHNGDLFIVLSEILRGYASITKIFRQVTLAQVRMNQAQIRPSGFFKPYQDLLEAIQPRMASFHNPCSGAIAWNQELFLPFLATPADMRSIASSHHLPADWFSVEDLVSPQVLRVRRGRFRIRTVPLLGRSCERIRQEMARIVYSVSIQLALYV